MECGGIDRVSTLGENGGNGPVKWHEGWSEGHEQRFEKVINEVDDSAKAVIETVFFLKYNWGELSYLNKQYLLYAKWICTSIYDVGKLNAKPISHLFCYQSAPLTHSQSVMQASLISGVDAASNAFVRASHLFPKASSKHLSLNQYKYIIFLRN